MADKKVLQHWPVIAMVFIVAAVFLVSLICYQVETTEHAVLMRFGKPLENADTSPGFHWKQPWDSVWRQDNRIQCFEGSIGVLEEIFTKDQKNIIVTAYIGWKISDDTVQRIKFMQSLGTIVAAEDELTALLRSYKNGVLGQYSFSDLVNIDPDKVKIAEIEAKILERIKADAADLYGIDVKFVGIKHIGFPESVTTKVIARMKAEREAKSQDIISAGKARAQAIKSEADMLSQNIINEAEAKAQKIRGDGDALAAGSYETFKGHEDLAAFLLKLNALKRSWASNKGTIIFDTQTPPFDILDPNTLEKLQRP